MCDLCSDMLFILENYDERGQGNGCQLSKNEVFSFVNYVQHWPQKQCMCCFKTMKNFEKMNNMVQVILNVAIQMIQSLPDTDEKEKKKEEKDETVDNKEEETMETEDGGDLVKWSLEEKERLLNYVTKVFLMNFPSYMAYKHVVHASLEQLSEQETSALNNYCEVSDPEVPIYLLRNVCFFIDSNGIASLKQCFDKADPKSLSFTTAHLLITVIANLRLWMNIQTVMQYIVPLRSTIIRYMCKLSDQDLRLAGNRNMTDLMWTAVKEPLETHFTFDKEGLDLAFKYFTCSTLTIRLAGIAQINSQINLYNESCNNDTLIDAERVGHLLGHWLIENKIIEHIFGPNLHVELIKQSQMILNLLAMENKITNEHIDCIWAASQLKHCSKQVYDILIPLIKNLELQPVQHLLKLVSSLDHAAHTESTLYVASALIKCVWTTCAGTSHSGTQLPPTQAQYSALQHEEDLNTSKETKHEVSSEESIQVSDETDKEKAILKIAHQRHRRRARHRNLGNRLPKHLCCSGGESEEECEVHSEESEEEHECLHHARQVPHSEGSESEVEASDTSEEEQEDEVEVIGGQCSHNHHNRLLIAQQRELLRRHYQEGHTVDSSEEEEEEEEEESEYYDSEDEELLKEARLVHMRHACHHTSEESSDLDEEAQLAQGRMSYQMAQQLLRKHHNHQQQKQMMETAQRTTPRKQDSVKMGKSPEKKQTKPKQEPEAEESKKEEKIETKENEALPPEQPSTTDTPMEELNPAVETEVYDVSDFVEQVHQRRGKKPAIQTTSEEPVKEGTTSGEEGEGSCHSSRISNKSEKNMADFDGEEFISDEELVQINAQRQFASHPMQQHLSNLASMYHTHLPHVGSTQHRPMPKEVQKVCSEFNFDSVCVKGNTLLWDLVQEDMAPLLPEGLASEAEKALCTLVCYSTDRRIKMKFIEACVENLAHHRSVVVSLRLLPKIFSSFQQYRNGIDTHHVTMWAEKELNMMSHFFIDLVHYTECKELAKPTDSLYGHKEQIQVRLSFLTCVFSSMGSPDGFRLNLEQVDTLWRCVALDTGCSDECLSWFLNQAKSKDHHAMGLETFKHIFLEKMHQLEPESMSVIGLNLFQQLSHLTRIANASFDTVLTEDEVCGIDQMWSIALRANNTDVSITAIQILNCYYINYGNGHLEKEEEFVKRCMDHLVQTLTDIEKSPETNLLIIQRGLVLLKNHLEAFRKRYAYHLRNWQIDGKGIQSHQRNIQEKTSANFRVILQPAGMAEKTQLEMSMTDLVAELRAEVARWWEGLHKQQIQRHQSESGKGGSLLSPILGAMLGDGPIRMITQGQELTVDMDEKTLGEMQFKDLQLVFVSVGASRPPRKMDGSLPSSCLPSPVPEKLPVTLLIREPHFKQLFMLLEELSKLDFNVSKMESQERRGLLTTSRILSRKVWELLMLLPTNQDMLQGFKLIVSEDCDEQKASWNTLLDSCGPHKLMYSLQIVESLSRPARQRKRSFMRSGGGDSIMSTDSEMDVTENSEEIWSQKFITKGGLKHLLNVFKSGSLQANEDEEWSQWNQECLAYLLRLISQFSVDSSDAEAGHDDVFESYESPRRKMKRKGGNEKIIIPRLNKSTLAMLNIDAVLSILMQILYDAAVPRETGPIHTGTWGRAEVVHYSLSFLVSWTYSCDNVRQALCSSPKFVPWLKRLTIEAPEPFVRREACMGLYRLCLGKTTDGTTGYPLLIPMITNLLSFLDSALALKPQKTYNDTDGFKEKEPHGPGCRDYFWLVCRFVDSVSKEDAKPEANSGIDLNDLAKKCSTLTLGRPYYETRQGFEEDDGLIGMLNLCTSILKHKPAFKTSTEGQSFLHEVFEFLFALPNPKKRYLPKSKSQSARGAAYDLLVEFVKNCVENFRILHSKMMTQHSKDFHAQYPWDYWPHEDGRSKCGYVGLTNLGATCYMATCMQHLYMIPQARQSVLQAKCTKQNRYEDTLVELQKMFAYLQESERKAYNPRSFCKTYTMDKQPLNTGEQKDMTEFFTDLISKLEDMSPEMRKLVKSLFGGVLTNNVVSLDCPHVSRTLEEFYTVRCQVTDMKNLNESLDEVTVKDMLEGDNMYTCSKCQKKVRAEKRACLKRLPRILCFNTMRYTFNMVTMLKEKVNTHFSFPLRLDMSQYMEKNLMGPDKLTDDDEDDKMQILGEYEDNDRYEYELIGVTVHTGTADGGHYYSFIRDRLHKAESGQDKWYLFNDAEVKSFDPSQIAQECFGGEMTSKTYDSVTDKFMDFSFEKTNSAYMLFYERCAIKPEEQEKKLEVIELPPDQPKFNFELTKELEEWIWQDNTQFLQDKNIFDHTYFGFMWQICGYIPTTLPKDPENLVSLNAAQLSTSFVLETLIHAKEKPTMVQWIELLTKQFNSCPGACEWFLDHMAESDWWPQQILIKCPNQMVRQMFQRLLIHVITQLRSSHEDLYLVPIVEGEDGEIDVSELGSKSCVTRFIRKMLSILEHGVRPHSKYLTEYFAFLLEFAKMGDEECFFMIQINAISTMVNFYLGQKAQENYVEIPSDDEDDEVITITDDTYKPLSLEKMITLISVLVEKSRGDDKQLHIVDKDYSAITGGKGFPFLFNQIRDAINLRQSCNLIFSLSRWHEQFAVAIVNMIFSAIKRLSIEHSQPFFKLLSMLVEFGGGPPGLPPFTQYVLQRFWDMTKSCPQPCLEWMSSQVTRNKLASHWILTQRESWVEPYLIANNNARVRNAAAMLLISLVPSNHFRQTFRATRSIVSPHKESGMSPEAMHILHQIYDHLLSLLPRAKLYVDPQAHGTSKLTSYFGVMSYCLISRTEKLMFGRCFQELWNLFQPKLCEPQISMHHNKQALMYFWYQACVDCPENIQKIVSNPNICKQIAYNYILADHDDQDVLMFNRLMLPSYYGLLRMCCQHSRSFTRQLASHQNINWAFTNIAPYPTKYAAAVDELFKMMKLMATKYPDSSEEEIRSVNAFKKNSLQMFLSMLDARSGWQTLISIIKILVDSDNDRVFLIYQGGLQIMSEAFTNLHVMYHEATACHVTGDIVDLLTIILPVLKVLRQFHDKKNSGSDITAVLQNWKDRMDFVKKLLTLLNSFTPPDIRQICIEVLREMVIIFQSECVHTMVPILTQSHISFQESNLPVPTPGPYFPRRGQKLIGPKSNIRPPRPQFNMMLHSSQVEATKGVDENYDRALSEFFSPYHALVDLICRVAVNQQILNEHIINLSAVVAVEGVPLHSAFFAKLWYEIYHSEVDRNCIRILCSSGYFIEYVDSVLLDERLSLNNHNIYQFFCNFFPKVYQQVLNDQGRSLLDSLVASVTAEKSAIENVRYHQDLINICERINGDLRAMLLIFSVQPPKKMNPLLMDSLHYILSICRENQQQRAEAARVTQGRKRSGSEERSPESSAEPTPSKKRRVSGKESEEEEDSSSDVEIIPDDSKEKSPVKEEENTSEKSESEKTVETSSEEEQQPGTSKDQETSSSQEPGPSKQRTEQRRNSSDSRNSNEDLPRQKERPTFVDFVAKQIDSIFSLIEKH